jgi:hypothetical protein
VLCWFSAGAASACATKLAIEKYGHDRVDVLYCDTLKYEHPDNWRFLLRCQSWFQHGITLLKSERYDDIFDVFDKTKYLVGVGGARCTTELKKIPRKKYQHIDDIQVFGYTEEETGRIKRFEEQNPEIKLDWILRDQGVDKAHCLKMVQQAGIELPAMYRLGYKNNNCIGCVKGQQGYWNKIRVDFPEAFDRMAKQERKMNVAINKSYAGDGKRKRVFLDELDPKAGKYEIEPDITCGPQCLLELGD